MGQHVQKGNEPDGQILRLTIFRIHTFSILSCFITPESKTTFIHRVLPNIVVQRWEC